MTSQVLSDVTGIGGSVTCDGLLIIDDITLFGRSRGLIDSLGNWNDLVQAIVNISYGMLCLSIFSLLKCPVLSSRFCYIYYTHQTICRRAPPCVLIGIRLCCFIAATFCCTTYLEMPTCIFLNPKLLHDGDVRSLVYKSSFYSKFVSEDELSKRQYQCKSILKKKAGKVAFEVSYSHTQNAHFN